MGRQDLVALALIIALIGSVAGYLAYQQMVMPQTVINRSEILQFSYQEEEVSGLVRFYISLDATGAELELHRFMENVSIPYADLVKYGLPPGTNLSARNRLRRRHRDICYRDKGANNRVGLAPEGHAPDD